MAVLGPRRRALAIPTSTIDVSSISSWRKAMFFEDISVPACSRCGLDAHPLARSLLVAAWILVASIDPDGPAARAGLLVGTSSRPGTQNRSIVREVMQTLGSDSIGKTIDLGLLRGGAPTTLKVVIGERPWLRCVAQWRIRTRRRAK